MRVRYFACPSRTWELALARAGPQLRHAVYAYRGYRKVVEQPRRWLSMPADVVSLVVGLDAGQRLLCRGLAADAGWTAYNSTVEGLSTQSSVCEAGTDLYGVEVALAPWAAFAVLGVEMRELAGAIAEPDALLGDRIHQLAGALAALPGWEQRFDLLDEVLAAWLDRGCAWSPRVAWAYDQLRQSGGAIPIGTLAERVGWRPRQLEYRFGEQVGLTPKATARVFRFRRAVRLLAGGDWTPQQTAAACGFSDQPHLTREFKTITGFTPDRFRAKIRATTNTREKHAARQVRTIKLPTP